MMYYCHVMQIKYIDQRSLQKQIENILIKYISLEDYKIFFFGSRVKGTNLEKSDIDVGILGQEQIPAEIKFQINEDLEKIPTFYKIDFVDFNTVPEFFKKEAMSNIEIFN